jgi:chloramphenicol-sensitive protein RarD
MSAPRSGYLYGLAAYLLWGFFPLYFKLLQPAGAVEILAHRVLWALAFLGLILLAARRWGFWRGLARRPAALAGIAFASCIIALNWGTYIYGVNTERIVETSLGYFINPLVTVLLGVLVLGERLRRLQWAALAIGALAVSVITVDYGEIPLIALTLAVSFGLYGLVKKRLGLPPAEGLLAESLLLAAPALGFLWWLSQAGGATFGQVSSAHTMLMLGSGAVTAVPLLLFAAAANRIPLTGLGILQYIAPLLQFLIGVLVFHEPMPAARLAGFVLVWIALMVFTTDAIRHTRRAQLDAASAGAAAAGPVAGALPDTRAQDGELARRCDVPERAR